MGGKRDGKEQERIKEYPTNKQKIGWFPSIGGGIKIKVHNR